MVAAPGTDKLTRYIYYGILVVVYCHIISLILGQYYLRSTVDVTENGWYGKMSFLSCVLLMPISVYCFFKYHKHFPVFINICYGLILVLIFIASINDLSLFSSTPTVFFSPKGLGTWINFGLLYFVVEEEYTSKILKVFKNTCFVLVVFNTIQIAMAGSISNRDIALDAVRDTTVVLLWVYPFFFLDNDDKTNIAKLTKYGMILMITFFAFAIASRSYLLTMGIFIFIKLRRDLREGQSTFILFCMIMMCVMAGYYIVVNIDKFDTLKDLSSVFTGRMGEDSRSSQLNEFIDQFKMDKLFTGVGPTGTWNWSGNSTGPYQWLDNQFLLVTWWFGLQTCIVYFLFLIYSMFKSNPMRLLKVTNSKILIFFWALACAGFGIYISVSSSLYYYFITLLVGIVTLNVRRVIVYQKQIEDQLVLKDELMLSVPASN